MLNCRSMRAAVTLSAVLLTLGIVFGIIAITTALTLPLSQLSLLLVLAARKKRKPDDDDGDNDNDDDAAMPARKKRKQIPM
jgi:hypothetical protein